MKIQDVFETAREEEKMALMQKHQELINNMKTTQKRKVEKKQNDESLKRQKDNRENDVQAYLASIKRVKAASIAARIARGEEIPKAQEDFLTSEYPDMLSDAAIVKNKISNVLKRIEMSSTKKDAESILQKADVDILTLPYKDSNTTVFDTAVKIVNSKE